MLENYTYLLLFLSSFVSGGIVLIAKPKFSSNLKLLLSFSGAFLLAICMLHLIPVLYEKYEKSIGIFILIGFVLQLLLEFFSKGIEHGHSHPSKNSLKAFPYAIFISLCLHAFIEGMALVETGHHGHSHGNFSLLTGIIIHKIPIAIVLITMLINQKISKLTTLISLFIFSIAAPVGLYIAETLGNSLLENVTILMALAVGVFLHISTTILFETSEGHKFDSKKFSIIILGFIIAILTL